MGKRPGQRKESHAQIQGQRPRTSGTQADRVEAEQGVTGRGGEAGTPQGLSATALHPDPGPAPAPGPRTFGPPPHHAQPPLERHGQHHAACPWGQDPAARDARCCSAFLGAACATGRGWALPAPPSPVAKIDNPPRSQQQWHQ